MNILESIVFALVQGASEFLPISSSGHLQLVKYFFGGELKDLGILPDITAHFATMLATVWVFRRECYDVFFSWLKLGREKFQLISLYNKDESFKWLVFIVLASLPAVVLGLLFDDFIESTFNSLATVTIGLSITGILLLSTRFIRPGSASLSWKIALIIGFAQAMAIFPGISRSGSTICAALLLSIQREKAGTFSFLMSVPVIAGASFLSFIKLDTFAMEPKVIYSLLIIFSLSFLTAIVALTWLLKVIRKGSFYHFSYYVIPLAMLLWIYLGVSS